MTQPAEIADAVVAAIHSGDVAGLQQLLADHPGVASAPLGGRYMSTEHTRGPSILNNGSIDWAHGAGAQWAAGGVPSFSEKRSHMACHERASVGAWYCTPGMARPSAAGLVKLWAAPP
jgi:hypothetical protein